MKLLSTLVIAAASIATVSFAEGDAAKGEKAIKKCKACHEIVADNGDVILKGGKTGPNLYGVIGRAAGGTDFAYSEAIKAAGAAGLVWDEENFVAFIADPNQFLKDKTGDAGARSKMSFKLNKDGADLVAYLQSVVK